MQVHHVHLLVSLPAIFLIALHFKAAGKPAEPVYDIEGNELNPGARYYVLPSDHSRSGGGFMLTQHNTSWPLFVAHDVAQPGNGDPVTVIPATNNLTNTEHVYVSSNVHIQYAPCAVSLESMAWRIGDREGVAGRRHVVAGEIGGDLGYKNDQFRIEKHGTELLGEYRIVFCAKVCKLCRAACQSVGVLNEGGKRWLALDGLPLTVVFKKSELCSV